MSKAEDLFSSDEKAKIITAIQNAEKSSSGEIRVHLENNCKGDVLDRAATLFEKLQLHKTELRNGVLFYLAVKEHKFAILGDVGINAVTPDDFWDNIKNEMIKHFEKEEFTSGLCQGIERAGLALQKEFPYEQDDVNELPDEISFGKN